MPKLMEVLEFFDETGHTMVKRVPENNQCEIKWGAQLTVRESQVAVFFRDGKIIGAFRAGRYILDTKNIPVLMKWVTSLGYGKDSPFRAEVYFLNMKLFPNLKWGTREPILFADSILKMIRVRAYGIFSIQIANPKLFVNKIVGTQGLYNDSDIEDYLKNILLSRFTDILSNKMRTVFEMPKNFDKLSEITKPELQIDFQNNGLSLHDFYINSVSVPPEVQELIDARGGMAAIGNIDEFMKFKVAMALEAASENPSGSASAGVGMGAGLGMGFMLPQMLQHTMASSHDSSKESLFDKIKKLKELLDIGAISNEEFEAKKKKLLDKI